VVQQLLAEAGHRVVRGTVSVQPAGPELPADWASLKSPETYLGSERSDTFAYTGMPVLQKPHVYTVPAKLRLNQWALAGQWTVGADAVTVNEVNGRLVYRFHARDVNLIMAPPPDGRPARFRVLIDGAPPGSAHGSDVDDKGNGAVAESRMYQLIRQSSPSTDREFEIQFLDSEVSAFDFTFG
jgi:hypothetical protein